MKFFRKLLFPFSILYDGITSIRNILYDIGVWKSFSFPLPIICVGNLSVGGTGKTPMIEYLIRLLGDKYQVATLSRGYKRKSKGFLLADEHTLMNDIGDEPFQYFSKFKNIFVAVENNRVKGVNYLLDRKPCTEVVLLDDAFQHRKIQAGYSILLTAYDSMFYNDYLLPSGNLRENSTGVNRADIVVVTKCPENLSLQEQEQIASKIGKKTSKIFFATIAYSRVIINKNGVTLPIPTQDFIAVAGIAKPRFFYDFLNINQESTITFADHHFFSKNDINRILKMANGRKIITTEKDFVRLQSLLPEDLLYYLPIEMQFLKDKALFDKYVLDFCKKNI